MTPGASTPPSRSLLAVLDEFADGRQQRNDNGADDHQSEIIFDDWNVAEKIPRHGQAANPDQCAQCAEQHEQTIIHQSDACHERRKGADDGQEAREQNGFAAVFLVKSVVLPMCSLLMSPVVRRNRRIPARRPIQ